MTNQTPTRCGATEPAGTPHLGSRRWCGIAYVLPDPTGLCFG